MTVHDRWEGLAAGHALDALEPEEEHDFLRHLRGCDLCLRTLAEMRMTAAHLAYAVEPATPPDSLRDSLMAAVHDGDRPPLATPGGSGLGARRVRREAARREVGLRPLLGLGSRMTSAAALVLVLVLALWNADLRGQVSRQEQALDLRRQAEELVTTPGTTVVPLGSGESAHGAAIVHGRRVMLVLSGLSPLQGRSAYVLWARDTSGTLHPVARFSIVNPGRPNLIPEMTLPLPGAELTELSVSQEILELDDDLPAAPSGVPFLRGSLP